MATVYITKMEVGSTTVYKASTDPNDSDPPALGTSSAPLDINFDFSNDGMEPWPIDVIPSSYSLCLESSGICTSQSNFHLGDTVGVDDPGIDPIVGYFRVRSSGR